MVAANGGRAVFQAIYFVVLARAMGASGYGAFVGGLAIIALVSPFVNLGAGNLIVMYGARDPSRVAGRWANSLLLTAVTGIPLTVLLGVGASHFSSSLTPLMVLFLALAELVFSPVCDAAGLVFVATEELRLTAALTLMLNVARTVAALAFALGSARHTAMTWALWYAGSTAVVALVSWAVVLKRIGWAALESPLDLRSLREGSYFSIAQSAVNVYVDIDKALLTRITGLAAAGVYGAAYRIVTIAFVPALSLFNAAYARFFRSGSGGVSSSRAVGRRLAPFLIAYSLIAGVLLFALAGLAPRVLGHGFSGAAGAIRWLAPLPLLQSAAYLGGDILTGGGRQGARSIAQVGTALLNVGLGIWWISGHGWLGAAWATLVSYGFLSVALFAAVAVFSRRDTAKLASTSSLGSLV